MCVVADNGGSVKNHEVWQHQQVHRPQYSPKILLLQRSPEVHINRQTPPPVPVMMVVVLIVDIIFDSGVLSK